MRLTLLSGMLLAGVIGTLMMITTSSEAGRVTSGTRDHLRTAMQGEAFAAAKYRLYADHARKSGNTELADLFERTAKVEGFEHLPEEANLAHLVGDTSSILRLASDTSHTLGGRKVHGRQPSMFGAVLV